MKTSNKKVAENHSSMRANIYIMKRAGRSFYAMQKMVSPTVGKQLGIKPTAGGVYMFRRTLETSSIKRARRNRDSLLDYIAGLHGQDGDRAMPRFNNPDHLTQLEHKATTIVQEVREKEDCMYSVYTAYKALRTDVIGLRTQKNDTLNRVNEWETV